MSAAFTPISTEHGEKVHTTTVANPIRRRRTRTSCGRTVAVTSEYAPDQLDRIAANTIHGYVGGICQRCATAADVAHLIRSPSHTEDPT